MLECPWPHALSQVELLMCLRVVKPTGTVTMNDMVMLLGLLEPYVFWRSAGEVRKYHEPSSFFFVAPD